MGPQNSKTPTAQHHHEEVTEAVFPEAHHHTPVYSKDSRRTDPLHRSPGREKKGACLKGWEEGSQLHPRILIVVGEVPKHKELKLKQEGVNKGKHLLMQLANTQKLPKESIDSYEDLRTAFRENYLQQTKHIKDPVEIHHIKQRDGESTEDFMERYKAEVLDVEGAPECMRISGFMHGITHPGLIKRLYERIPRSMDEMYRMTTSFLQGEVAAFSHGQRKASSSWKQSEGGINRISRKASKTNKDRIESQIDSHSSPKRQKKFSLWKKESSKPHHQ
ncbi:reverse transcriptase domain-containing protein [Tanacetum coccineum]